MSDFGVGLDDGPLPGLCDRSVIVLDESGTLIYNTLVPQVSEEP